MKRDIWGGLSELATSARQTSPHSLPVVITTLTIFERLILAKFSAQSEHCFTAGSTLSEIILSSLPGALGGVFFSLVTPSGIP